MFASSQQATSAAVLLLTLSTTEAQLNTQRVSGILDSMLLRGWEIIFSKVGCSEFGVWTLSLSRTEGPGTCEAVLFSKSTLYGLRFSKGEDVANTLTHNPRKHCRATSSFTFLSLTHRVSAGGFSILQIQQKLCSEQHLCILGAIMHNSNKKTKPKKQWWVSPFVYYFLPSLEIQFKTTWTICLTPVVTICLGLYWTVKSAKVTPESRAEIWQQIRQKSGGEEKRHSEADEQEFNRASLRFSRVSMSTAVTIQFIMFL